ncbi:MAG: FHA domain-containing protein [Gemmataceae bacterium]
MIKCPFCHFENEDGALFCERCASDLAAAKPAEPAPVVAEPMPYEAIPIATAEPLEAIPLAPIAPLTPIDLTPVIPASPLALEAAERPIAVPTPTPTPAPASDPAGATLPAGAQPRLLVLRGQKRNVEYPIYEGLNFIGRADEKPVDIDLEEQEPPDRIWCSRQHACISFENDKLVLEDLNSANGTYVNRTRVYPNQKRELSVNDIIQIGNVQMKVLA